MRTIEQLKADIKNMSNIYEIKEVLYNLVETLSVAPVPILPPTIIPSTPTIDYGFLNELIDLKGIGKTTAEMIIKIYPTRELLREDIKSKKELPFNKKIDKILIERYG